MADQSKLDADFDSLPDAKLDNEFDALPSMVDRGLQSSTQPQQPASSGAPASQPGSLAGAMTGGVTDTMGDLARGAGQGLSFGFSDELAGAGQAGLDVLRDPSKAQEFLKLYRQHQQEQQLANETAAKRSPIAYNVGDYGSAILPAILSGGGTAMGSLGLKGLGKLAAKGAVIGGTQALGRSTNTIEENPTGLAGDVIEGTTAGAVLGPALKLAPKTTSTVVGGLVGGSAAQKDIQEGDYLSGGAKLLGGLAGGYALGRAASKPAIQDHEGIPQSPFKGQMREAYKAGQAGEGYNTSKDVLSREAAKQDQSVKGIKNIFDEAEGKLLENKRNILEGSDEVIRSPQLVKKTSQLPELMSNSIIQPEPEKVAAVQPFLDFIKKSPEVAGRDLQEITNALEMYSSGGLSAKAADNLQQKVRTIAYQVNDPSLKGAMQNLDRELGQQIELAIPDLGNANKDIHQFLKAGRETLLSQGRDPEVSKIQIGRLRNEDLKTEQGIGKLLGSLRNYTPNATRESQGAVDKTMASLSNLFQENPDLAKKVGINLPGLEKQIYTAADQTAVANKLIPGTLGDLKPSSGMFGIPQLGEKGALKAANLAGQFTGSKIARKSSELYRLPKESLMEAAQQLQSSGIPGLNSVGQGLLKAIESGDQQKTNATLFTILQNPSARKFLGYSPENEAKGDNFGQ